MLDIQFIRDNPDEVAKKSKQKGYEVDVSKLLELDTKRRGLIQKTDEQRAILNKASEEFQSKPPTEQQRQELKSTKQQLAGLEEQQKSIETEYLLLIKAVPNLFPDDTPIGDESANRVEKKWGNSDPKDFKTKDHLTWAEERGLLDFDRGAKVSGSKFYFQTGELVELEQAVLQMAMQTAVKHGFTLVNVPHLVNSRIVEGTGFLARGEEEQIYNIVDEDLHLIATAEIPLTGFHADEILDLNQPKLYAGISPAYRREAGTYGKHSKGLYRVHQFNKLELYVFCRPADSERWHQKLIAIEEEICQALQIPYRLVRIASGDLGAPAYKKYDVEYWSPSDKSYRELMSCSNVTDYQARRLNIRHRDKQGNVQYVHTLNGTAAAFSRVAIALIENCQTRDGKVNVPEALRPFMGGKEHIG